MLQQGDQEKVFKPTASCIRHIDDGMGNSLIHCSYTGGVYIDNSNSTIDDIDHDVEVVGWGEEHGQKFWTVRNSWGTFWGELGFFRVERGKDALFMENGDCW